MQFIKALALLIIIPAFGYGVSVWVLSDLNQSIAASGGNYTIAELCGAEIASSEPQIRQLCSEVSPILLMRTVSIISAIVAAALLISFIVLATVVGTDRAKIARVFPPLVFVTLLVMAAQVLVQGAILTYGAYVAESYAIERVHLFLIAGIGIGALVGGSKLISSSFNMARKQSMSVLGLKLEPEKYPRLFAMIDALGDKLGARKPEHVVVGLDPNFYVTSADVKLMGSGTELEGETLYLSLPLARILETEELKGIIGHELGHFRGDDTVYSLKFSPVYAGLSHAVTALDNNENSGGGNSIATLPAYHVLSYIIDVFHTNVSSISRAREFEADRAASEVAEPRALATSLLKISLYASAWNDIQQRIVDRMRTGQIARNMSRIFGSVVRYNVNTESIPKVINSIAESTISHPTDSHPPTASRIAELGLNIDDIEHDSLLIPSEPCIDLFENHLAIEEELTGLQQQYYVAMGVKVPEQNQADGGATLLAALGAHMVVADGKVEAEEIDEAESMGMGLSEAFDYIEFREYCQYPDSLPELSALLEASSGVSDEGKAMIIEYLGKIAAADDEVSPEETALIDQVRSAFGKN